MNFQFFWEFGNIFITLSPLIKNYQFRKINHTYSKLFLIFFQQIKKFPLFSKKKKLDQKISQLPVKSPVQFLPVSLLSNLFYQKTDEKWVRKLNRVGLQPVSGVSVLTQWRRISLIRDGILLVIRRSVKLWTRRRTLGKLGFRT